jgi:hypothetical protein
MSSTVSFSLRFTRLPFEAVAAHGMARRRASEPGAMTQTQLAFAPSPTRRWLARQSAFPAPFPATHAPTLPR